MEQFFIYRLEGGNINISNGGFFSSFLPLLIVFTAFNRERSQLFSGITDFGKET